MDVYALSVVAAAPVVGATLAEAARCWPRWGAFLRGTASLPNSSALSPCSRSHSSTAAQGAIGAALATAVAVTAMTLAPSGSSLAVAALGWALLFAAMIDLRSKLLPDVVWLGLTAFALASAGLRDSSALLAALEGFGLGFGLLWCVNFWHRRTKGSDGLGMGDAKLLGAAGAWLGPSGVGWTLAGAAAATLLALVLLRQSRSDRRVPFGPGLALSFYCTALLTSSSSAT